MSEAVYAKNGQKAYEALFEGNGDSITTRLKVLETRVELWHNISTKLLIACVTGLLGTIAQIVYHAVVK